MARSLYIGPREKRSIATVIEHAKANRTSRSRLVEMVAGEAKPIGDSPDHVAFFSVGFRVVFSIEEHQPGEWYRHLSVSVEGDKWPNPAAVQVLAEEFGFTGALTGWHVYQEEPVQAVNVLQPFKE